MASHDAGWEAFREELRHWMQLRRMTSKDLAARLNLAVADAAFDEHIVKRWRHSTAPPLGTVRHIAAILGMSEDRTGQAPHDPAFILRRMSLLAEQTPGHELLDAGFRLQELRLRLNDLRASIGEHSARSGAGQLVQVALSHGYAAAVFPVWDGPAGYPMHVADRLDFRTPRPGLAEIEANTEMQRALVANSAVPGSRSPRFSTAEADLAQQSHWAIQLIGRPFSRNGKSAHRAVPAIAVSAATTTAWGDDVGAILARLLGYGFVTTREIARELSLRPIATEALRGEVHEQFLSRPPTHHVWSHHSTTLAADNPLSPWAPAETSNQTGLVHIRLVEDDDALAWTGPWLSETLGVSAEEAVSTAMANAALAQRRLDSDVPQQVRERTLLIPVAHETESSARWENTLRAVLTATHFLDEIGLGRCAELDEVHARFVRDEPDIAPSMLRWLADNRCPIVAPTYATRPDGTGL